jgi:hypothetical protein
MESTRIQAKARLVLLRRENESYIVQRLRLMSHRVQVSILGMSQELGSLS